jgi:hypothetical protein
MLLEPFLQISNQDLNVTVHSFSAVYPQLVHLIEPRSLQPAALHAQHCRMLGQPLCQDLWDILPSSGSIHLAGVGCDAIDR